MLIYTRDHVLATYLKHVLSNLFNRAATIEATASELCLSVEAVREALEGFA